MKVFSVLPENVNRSAVDDRIYVMLDKEYDMDSAVLQDGDWRTVKGIRAMVPLEHRPTTKEGWFDVPEVPEAFKGYQTYVFICGQATGFALSPK